MIAMIAAGLALQIKIKPKETPPAAGKCAAGSKLSKGQVQYRHLGTAV